MSKKRIPVPIPFVVVVVGLIALFVFFGAWAVSVDAANHERELSFAFASNNSGFGTSPSNPSGATGQTAPAQVAYSGSVADTWWGKSLIIACPLH